MIEHNTLRLGVWQSGPVRQGTDEALACLDKTCAIAARAGVELLLLPEMFITGYNIGVDTVHALAESVDGPIIRRITALAREHQVGVTCGFPERAPDGRIYNAAALIDPHGELRSLYRKTHLYGAVDRAQFSAGEALAAPVEFNGWRVALAICYDIEFPEVARAHALAGAEAIITPTANMHPYASVATRLVPARAQENALYVAYGNYVGHEGDFDYCGLSCVVGPDGEDLARAGDEEELIVADLDKQYLQHVRARSTYLRDRRTTVYSGAA